MPEPKEPVANVDKLIVYDVPINLIKQYISMAKLFCDNKMWKALERGMELMLAEYSGQRTEWQQKFELRLSNVETALNALLLERREGEPKELKTFGGDGTNEKTQTG